ncbi:MAG: tail fiber domain-containing protein [Bacteroidetes bacterium]|nr:tail fiber domain-containing protein [Bacteroidota bacterium]
MRRFRKSNSVVIGSINGTNSATVSAKVGIGTTAPVYTLDVVSSDARTGNFYNTAIWVDNYAVTGNCQNSAAMGMEGVYGGQCGVYGESNYCCIGNRYGVYGTATGGATNWAGYFNGAVFGTSYTTSDRKLKRDIQPLEHASALLARLKPASYYYRTDEYSQLNLAEGLQYGLLADEVKEIVPSAVKKAKSLPVYENHDASTGKVTAPAVEFDALNYTELIPIMIATIQEQQQQINHLTELLEGRK